MRFIINNVALFLLVVSSIVTSQHIYSRDISFDSLLEARRDTYTGVDVLDHRVNHSIPLRLHARSGLGTPQRFETRDAGSISNLELRDLISHLIRRGNKSGGKPSGRARKNLKANSRPSNQRQKPPEQPKVHEPITAQSGNGYKVKVNWKKGAVEEMKHPLSQKWGKNKAPVQRHEEIVRNYASKIKGAYTVIIHHAAHPGGSNPTEKDHITAVILNYKGNPIRDPQGYPRHHIYTGREKNINLKPFLTPSLKNTVFETKGKNRSQNKNNSGNRNTRNKGSHRR